MRVLLPAALAACALSAAVQARAAPLVRLDFAGVIDVIRPGVNGPLDGFGALAPEPVSAVNGYLVYDAATPATSPGVWDLPTATYHATFGDVTLDSGPRGQVNTALLEPLAGGGSGLWASVACWR